MKFLGNFFEKIKPQFEEGGKLKRFHVLFDGFYTFLFTPKHTTSKGTHIKDGIDLKRTMFIVVNALIPCLLFGMWNTGNLHFIANGVEATFWAKVWYGALKVIPIIVVSYGVGLGIEFIIAGRKGHAINEGFLVSGMLIPLIMPADIPLWVVAVATAFAVVIGKEVFGGTGMNIVNVALTARALIFFGYPSTISGDKVWYSGQPDGFSGATPMGNAASTIDMNGKMAEAMAEGRMDAATTLGNKISSTIETLPDFWDSFLGFIPGSIGETSALACLLGAGILITTGIGSWKIMLSMLIGGISMGLIFNIFAVNPFMEVPWYMHLVWGGFAFGMVFMATDPVTAAQTETGKYIYGFFCGFFGIMIRVFNPAYPEGIMLAILFMNIMAPIIDHYVIQSNIKRRQKRLKAATVVAE